MAFAILCFAAIGTNWGISGGGGISDKCFFGRKSALFFFCLFAVAPSPTLAAPVIVSLPLSLKRLVVVYVLLV